MSRSEGVDVLIRTHTPKRMHELDRALFSLNVQSFSPLHPIIITQNFSPSDLAELEKLIARYQWDGGVLRPRVISVEGQIGVDIRSKLLNIGIAEAKSRFVAFLDFDDYMYANAYEYLVAEALAHKVAIAFGNVVIKQVRTFENYVFNAAGIRDFFRGKCLTDLFEDNFCPIHSFVIDRSIVPDSELYFDEGLTRLEDYDLLLRVCSRFPVRFESRARTVAVYNWQVDGSNSIRVNEVEGEKKTANEREWVYALHQIALRKKELQAELDERRRCSDAVGSPVAEIGPSQAVSTNGPDEPEHHEVPPIFPIGHFYSPVVNVSELRRSKLVERSRGAPIPDVKIDLQNQLKEFIALKDFFSKISFPRTKSPDFRYWSENDQFGIGDALTLSGFVQKYRPRQIVEVGSGFSSAVILDTLDRMSPDARASCTFIEPHTERLRDLLRGGDESQVTIIETYVQNVDLAVFERLERNDILFLDTTHVSKTGSDVNFHLFEVLPRLASGVLIHFHDILRDFEYSDRWIFSDNRSWNEIYILRAFLMNNESYDMVLFNDQLAGACRDRLLQTAPLFMENPGGALWLQKK